MSGIITDVRQLVVLGASGGRPTASQACSGFLIEWDGVRVVLDLGYAESKRKAVDVMDKNCSRLVKPVWRTIRVVPPLFDGRLVVTRSLGAIRSLGPSWSSRRDRQRGGLTVG